MTGDNIEIPKITFDSDKSKTGSDVSVLVPGQLVKSQENVDSKDYLTQKSPVLPQKPFGIGKIFLYSSLAFFLVLLIFSAAVGIPAYTTYQKGLVLYRSVNELEKSAKSQDLAKIKVQINQTSKDLESFESSYKLLSWTKILPYVGEYVADMGHGINAAQSGMQAGITVIEAIEPYSDLLGFIGANGEKTATALDGAKTAQDRIDFVVKSLPGLLPKIDEIAAKVAEVEKEVSQINADRYPEQVKGVKLRQQIKTAQELISESSNLLVNGKPLIENAPYLLGMESPRTYFLLFQNDKELRPTGGFMTGYAIMTVDKAKFNPVLSDDIYNLDAKYRPSVPAPSPIVKYIKGPYILSQNLRLRDMNWSPDFPTSMEAVSKALKEVGIKNIDGIIAVDTRVLENLLNVIGPIGVPGFGNFSTEIDPECNCSQVIHALEAYADVEGPIIWDPLTGKIIQRPPNSENRKKIIGPLMNSILANAMGQPKEKLPALFTAAFDSLLQKDVLLYLFDEKVQKSVVDFGIGGAIREYNNDYLHINDANLGGRKSNLYATQEVSQTVKVGDDGSVLKTVVITYKNPEKHDGWLNSVLPTWVRIYVPRGSELLSADGFEAKTDPYEELNKTVYSGYFQLRPEGVSKITLQYKLPFKINDQYKLLVQKQPGSKDYLYTLSVNKNIQEFRLTTDKEIAIGL